MLKSKIIRSIWVVGVATFLGTGMTLDVKGDTQCCWVRCKTNSTLIGTCAATTHPADDPALFAQDCGAWGSYVDSVLRGSSIVAVNEISNPTPDQCQTPCKDLFKQRVVKANLSGPVPGFPC